MVLISGEEGNTTEILVKTSSGKTLALHLDKNITVRQLKIKLEEVEGTPHEEQRLYVSTKQLRDNDCVSQYDSSSIDMRLNTLGGNAVFGVAQDQSTIITSTGEDFKQ
jgi:hypothetical protein